MISFIAGAASLLCLIYYLVIGFYAGFSTSFAYFWPLAAVFFALIAVGMRYIKRHPRKLPLWIPVSAFTLLMTGVIIFVTVEAFVFMGAVSSDTQGLDYVIVLGAPVNKKGISKTLRQRLDKAIEYSRTNPGTIFVLSGGKTSEETESESAMMYDYMLHNGVPAEQMVIEDRSESTVENIAYSRVVIERLEDDRKQEAAEQNHTIAPGPYLLIDNRPLQIGILTSNYHVYRAKMIARKWGIPNVSVISCKTDYIVFPHLCVRECAAILKDRLMGNM